MIEYKTLEEKELLARQKGLNDVSVEEWNLSSKAAIAGGSAASKDIQVGGDHYKTMKHQPLEIVLDTEGYEAFRGACLCKVYKYIGRKKESRLEDYRKAQHILNWLVEEEEKRL